MKVNWDEIMVDMDGEVIKENGDKPLTLGRVAINSLVSLSQADSQLSGEEKFKLGQLAQKIHSEKDAEFEVEEIATVKKKIGQLYAPYIVFKAYSLLK